MLKDQLSRDSAHGVPGEYWLFLPHSDFLSDIATVIWIDHKNEEECRVTPQCGPHTLIARIIVGQYPNCRNVIPGHLPESVTIPETHRPAFIAWLRLLKGKSKSVCLTW